MSDTPIADHALLSDCNSAALVDSNGSVVWWCAPRFDSPSLFGQLLDRQAGYFSIRPSRVEGTERRYLDETLVLETSFRCDQGELVLVDGLGMAEGVRGHDLGKRSPHRLLRNARCVSGSIELEIDFVPRLEYGLTTPALSQVDGGIVAAGGPTALVLSTGTHLDITDGRGRARGTVQLTEGDEVAFAVEYASSWQPPPPTVEGDEVRRMIDDTSEAWRSWGAEHQNYTGPFEKAVSLAGRVLQGLTFVPTGAIVAAPTTSIPETIGGTRNWDYRFSWVRDASLTLNALWVAACPDEEQQFFRFLTTAGSSVHHRDQLQIMFGIGGERDLTERELPWLEGWRNSSPVRVGNGAWDQRQNDVYGELLAAAHQLRDRISWGDESLRRMLIALADLAGVAWTEKDHGIWEMRDEPRHHLYSKLMCWVALDRAIDMADLLEAADRVSEWQSTRDKIREDILENGWNDGLGAFTQSYESSDLDASALMIPIVGFLPADDPRVLATISAIEAGLTDSSGLVMRYRASDGLDGEEGAFLLCTFWLSHAYALAGNVGRAREVFDIASAFANDVGLFAEEVDSGTGALLGNFPQAFSHIGLVNAAWAIDQAERAPLGED